MKLIYKGKKIKLEYSVKRYISSIGRRLNLPYKTKVQVLSDVFTGICIREEKGESYDQIIKSMGTPQQVAEELEEEMQDYLLRKSPIRFLFLILVFLGVVLEGGKLFTLYTSHKVAESFGIIGGADGPTSYFFTTGNSLWIQCLPVILILVGIVGFYLFRHVRPKRNK